MMKEDHVGASLDGDISRQEKSNSKPGSFYSKYFSFEQRKNYFIFIASLIVAFWMIFSLQF